MRQRGCVTSCALILAVLMSVASCGVLNSSATPATLSHREAPSTCGEIEELTPQDYQRLDNVGEAKRVLQGASMHHLAEALQWMELRYEENRFQIWVCRAVLGDDRARQVIGGGSITRSR